MVLGALQSDRWSAYGDRQSGSACRRTPKKAGGGHFPIGKQGAVGSCAVSGPVGDMVCLGPHWPGPIPSALLWVGGRFGRAQERGSRQGSGEGLPPASPARRPPGGHSGGCDLMGAKNLPFFPGTSENVSVRQQMSFVLSVEPRPAFRQRRSVVYGSGRGVPSAPPHTPPRLAGKRWPALRGVGVAFPGGSQPFRSKEGREGLIPSAEGHCSAACGREARRLCPQSPWQPQKMARAYDFEKCRRDISGGIFTNPGPV